MVMEASFSKIVSLNNSLMNLIDLVIVMDMIRVTDLVMVIDFGDD